MVPIANETEGDDDLIAVLAKLSFGLKDGSEALLCCEVLEGKFGDATVIIELVKKSCAFCPSTMTILRQVAEHMATPHVATLGAAGHVARRRLFGRLRGSCGRGQSRG